MDSQSLRPLIGYCHKCESLQVMENTTTYETTINDQLQTGWRGGCEVCGTAIALNAQEHEKLSRR